jgi:hypothetical protein
MHFTGLMGLSEQTQSFAGARLGCRAFSGNAAYGAVTNGAGTRQWGCHQRSADAKGETPSST